MNIWQQTDGARHIKPIIGKGYRLTHKKHAPLTLVDTLEEQAVLEGLIERAHTPSETSSENGQGSHYLLTEPFRNPPLEHGSRFGGPNEPSLFYGGKELTSAMAEVAYYRFVFWHSIKAPPVKDSMRVDQILFSFKYRTQHGIQLQQPPFDAYKITLTNPMNYGPTHHLGHSMREAQVEAFEYISARDVNRGYCVALFTPNAFANPLPTTIENWFCLVTGNTISLKPTKGGLVHTYNLEQFLVDGTLPQPA